MAFDLKQSLKLGQNLLMTPALQQAIKLLQLSRIELEQYVSEQLAENPTLEEGLDSNEELSIAEKKERESTEEEAHSDRMESAKEILDQSSGDQDMNWESFSQMQDTRTPKKPSADGEVFNYENVVSASKNLTESLMTQISELDFKQAERDIAEYIIGNIDERGYLTSSLEELAGHLKVEETEVDDVLDTIQRFEPNGVGARDLKECLLIQLRNSRLKNGIIEKIVEEHLSSLETRNFDHIAKKLNIDVQQVIDNVQVISELEPIPGREFDNNSSQYVVPDVYVFKIGDEWRIALNEEGLPKLRVSNMYQDLAQKKKGSVEDKAYLQDKIKAASWLIKSIQQRQRTIFRVTESILNKQMEFFEKGVEHLKPMILKDISEEIEMHESTISRVTNSKYMHTPRGIFELKYFFNSPVSRSDGDDMASESVRKLIADLIKVEDTKKPMSDQKIVEKLEEAGIALARRTVAKYRESMGILPSSKRKRYY